METLKIPKDTCAEIGGKWSVHGCVVKGTPNPEIKEAIEKKGYDWILGAMLEESIGYYTPDASKFAIRRYFEGEKKDYSERCAALYDSDLEKMLLSDIRGFKFLEERCPEKAKRVIEIVKKIREMSPVQQTTFGLMYPTLI